MAKNDSNFRRMKSDLNTQGKLRSKLSMTKEKDSSNPNLSHAKSYFESNISMLGQQLKKNKGRKTLILCLDEVLLHYEIGNEENGQGDYEF
eukprot:CAMPEP_0197001548 /NCGR_PEP_ID=MMETSP1380-20130617/6226_1 /TAXON_ID=5936 /ORGANISM="Euplotes crassus, Strain CT5" /LENGTH=90 /DNA_ID=CAMNT_0042419257 /DNA_START=312 /DNA_END=584 /DNA_ORIENTATION=+